MKNNNKNLLEKLKKENNKIKDKLLRALAELDNYKKRNEKEKEIILKNYIKNVIQNILPILDDFNRLIKEEKVKKNNGIYLIYKKFKNILENFGVKKIKVKKGDNFDLNLHYAISQKKVNNEKMKNKVIKIIENGYYLNDEIIRCTKVIVGN
ncbi:MAG: nucleotide exchange factor GrpE [Candidatus Shikimatogenerans bostrichidophilus]|nr:MAG: nucleotide exchange factor GrpE [Candidatus Shikimatogenerans bostrichidophilus]